MVKNLIYIHMYILKGMLILGVGVMNFHTIWIFSVPVKREKRDISDLIMILMWREQKRSRAGTQIQFDLGVIRRQIFSSLGTLWERERESHLGVLHKGATYAKGLVCQTRVVICFPFPLVPDPTLFVHPHPVQLSGKILTRFVHTSCGDCEYSDHDLMSGYPTWHCQFAFCYFLYHPVIGFTRVCSLISWINPKRGKAFHWMRNNFPYALCIINLVMIL